MPFLPPKQQVKALKASPPNVIWEEGHVAAPHSRMHSSAASPQMAPRSLHTQLSCTHPVGCNRAPCIPPFPWGDPKIQVPASSLDPPDPWPQTAFRSDQPFLHKTLSHRQTDEHMVRTIIDHNMLLTLHKQRRGVVIINSKLNLINEAVEYHPMLPINVRFLIMQWVQLLMYSFWGLRNDFLACDFRRK